jgi:hypothetical protein
VNHTPEDADDRVDDWAVIAQAQRALSARYGITFAEGAKLLTRKARRVDRSVSDVATGIVDGPLGRARWSERTPTDDSP